MSLSDKINFFVNMDGVPSSEDEQSDFDNVVPIEDLYPPQWLETAQTLSSDNVNEQKSFLTNLRGDKLVLRNCEIKDTEVSELFEGVLGRLKNLAVIHSKLVLNRRDDRMDTSIVRALGNNRMKELYIHGLPSQAFTQTMCNLNTNLKYLKFRPMDAGVEAFDCIGRLLLRDDSNLQTLDISDALVEDEHIRVIGQALSTNTTLKELRCRKSQISSDGLQYIATGLAENKALKILDLSNIATTKNIERGTARLLMAVQTSNLEELYFVNNTVGFQRSERSLFNFMSDEEFYTAMRKGRAQEQFEDALKKAISNSKLRLLDFRGVARISSIEGLQAAVNENKHNIRVILTAAERRVAVDRIGRRRRGQRRRLMTHEFETEILTPGSISQVIDLTGDSDADEVIDLTGDEPFSSAAGGGLYDILDSNK